MDQPYGRFTRHEATLIENSKRLDKPFWNNLTRRNASIVEAIPSQKPASSLVSANVKSLRLFRTICRLIPFIMRVREIQYRGHPIQAKRNVANHFRGNSKITDLSEIDYLVSEGYEFLWEAQWHICNNEPLYKFLFGANQRWRDHGKDLYSQHRANKMNREQPSAFLKGFYKGNKTHEA